MPDSPKPHLWTFMYLPEMETEVHPHPWFLSLGQQPQLFVRLSTDAKPSTSLIPLLSFWNTEVRTM